MNKLTKSYDYTFFMCYLYFLHIYMFDFDKQLPPSSIKKEKLLLQISRDCIITSFNQEVPGIIHVHVLLDPVGDVSEEILK